MNLINGKNQIGANMRVVHNILNDIEEDDVKVIPLYTPEVEELEAA